MKTGWVWTSPLDHSGWDEALMAHEGSSCFHSSGWARCLVETYGYQPCYLLPDAELGSGAVLPLMDVSTACTPRRAVGLPFTDSCRPLTTSAASLGDLFSRALERGREAGWRTVELRGGEPPREGASRSAWYYGHTLDLTVGEEALWSGLSSNTRRNIRKARDHGVTTEHRDDLEAMEIFSRLNALTRRRHGLPPQPDRFFRRLHANVIARGGGTVVLARHESRVTAAALFLFWGDRVDYKYGASDEAGQSVRPNNLVMWDAIARFAADGRTRLGFGRTDATHDGLRRFKLGWGTREHEIDYYKYDLREDRFVQSAPATEGVHNRLFEKMPLPVLRWMGSMLYKHMG